MASIRCLASLAEVDAWAAFCAACFADKKPTPPSQAFFRAHFDLDPLEPLEPRDPPKAPTTVVDVAHGEGPTDQDAHKRTSRSRTHRPLQSWDGWSSADFMTS